MKFTVCIVWKTTLAAAALAGCVALSGCVSFGKTSPVSSAGDSLETVLALRADDGSFAYPGLPFGSTAEQASHQLGVELGEPQTSPAMGEEYQFYFPEGSIGEMFGEEVKADLQFYRDGLYAITWAFDTDDKEVVEEVLEAMQEQYGEPSDQRETDAGNRHLQSFRWVAKTAQEEETFFNCVVSSVVGENNHAVSKAHQIGFGVSRPVKK